MASEAVPPLDREDADEAANFTHERPTAGLINRSSSKVRLQDEAETISPLILPNEKEVDGQFCLDNSQSRRIYTSSLMGKRMSSRSSLRSSTSIDTYGPPRPAPSSDSGQHLDAKEILAKVNGWLHEEKSKRHLRRHSRSGSGPSDGMALEKLEEILKTMNMGQQDHSLVGRSSRSGIPPSSYRKLRRQSSVCSSDTDFGDVDFHVPDCDVALDNSKTLAYSGGASSSQINLLDESLYRTTTGDRENSREAWKTFKFEIVRLIHTLRIKGWRKLPMDNSEFIEVKRLCGALTNAVYVVSPPHDTSLLSAPHGRDNKAAFLKPPPKVLLRIYGPHVEHLINRQEELQILKRLARKRIGPRMLGTFANGRFEEFFEAETLKPQDLRNPSTSKQIAMRMRELHNGIELLPEERARGPFLWQNWNKWVDRCEGIATQLDKHALKKDAGARAFVCGTPWPLFRKTVEAYKPWLEAKYGGADKLRERLVFAHNDTQYGNILRLKPPGESPLLLPANEHRQLVVIDFEYANANTPSFELANHFTEWCYNYHDPERSWACNDQHYPTTDEQRRFARAYLAHRPHYSTHGSARGASSTASSPVLRPTDRSAAGLNNAFSQPEDLQLENSSLPFPELEPVDALLNEVRFWRLANSAQWVSWGIMQARVPTYVTSPNESTPVFTQTPQDIESGQGSISASDPLDATGKSLKNLEEQDSQLSETQAEQEAAEPVEGDAGQDEDEEEFEYLSYARDRALFFWGDALQLGVVQENDLPPELVREVKIVRY